MFMSDGLEVGEGKQAAFSWTLPEASYGLFTGQSSPSVTVHVVHTHSTTKFRCLDNAATHRRLNKRARGQ